MVNFVNILESRDALVIKKTEICRDYCHRMKAGKTSVAAQCGCALFFSQLPATHKGSASPASPALGVLNLLLFPRDISSLNLYLPLPGGALSLFV